MRVPYRRALWLFIAALPACGHSPGSQAGFIPAYSPAHQLLLAAFGRLAVGSPQPCGSFGAPAAALERGSTVSPAYRRVATMIERDLLRARTARHLGAAAALRALSGHPGAAVALLQEAVALAPRDARLWSDLAAARLLAPLRPAAALDVIDALAAADRALRLAPGLGEARVNLALALERLFLPTAARQAWCQTLPMAPTADWRAFLASRCQASEPPSRPVVWQVNRASLEAAMVRRDGAAVRRLVASDHQAAREFAMGDLLRAWSDDVLAGRSPDAAGRLANLSAIGEALAGASHDFTVADTARVFGAVPAAALADTARAARNYVEGRRLYKSADVEGAVPLLQAAVRRLDRLSSPLALWARLWLGGVSFHRNRYESAIRQLTMLLALPGIERHPNLVAYSEWLTGACYLRTGRFAVGLRWYRDAARHLQTTREELGLGGIYSLTSEALDFLGEDREAWEMRYRALSLLQAFPDSVELQNLLREGAREVETSGELGAALWLQDESLWVARRTGRPELICYTLLQRSRLRQRLGLTPLALADLNAARIERDHIAGRTLRERLTVDLAAAAGELDAAVAPRERAALLSTAIAYYDSRHLDLELAPALLARAQLSLALGAADRAEADLRWGIELFERQRAEIADHNLRFSILDTATKLFDQMVRLQIEQRQSPAVAFEFAERGRTTLAGLPRASDPAVDGSGRMHARADTRLLAQISTALSRRAEPAIVLEYAVLPSDLLIWRVQSNGYRFIRVHGDTEALRQLTRRFLTLLHGDASHEELAALSSELYRRLIEPLGDDLPAAAELIIVPDKFLNAVPFAALREARTGLFLIESHALALCPQAALLVQHDAGSTSRLGGGIALVVGNPSFDPATFPWLGPLPGAAKEASRIASLYPRNLVLLGAAATRARFLAALNEASVVHFAGHALAGDGSPSATQLVLAGTLVKGDAGTVSGRDLLSRRFPALRLVVLSACSTMAPDATRSGGLFGLARPFLEGGADSVVGTLWQLDDDAANTVLPSFHRLYRDSGAAAASLRTALLPLVRGPTGAPQSPAKWSSLCVVERD